MTVVLELIPIAGIFFAFTNTVGAALWAADMEREQELSKRDGEATDRTSEATRR